MDGNEDPKLFPARAERKVNVLSTLGIHKSDRDVVRLITRRLPSEFCEVEQRTSLLRPGITRSEMEKIVRTSYANRNTKMLEDRNLAAIVSTSAALADSHALGAAGGFQGNSGGGRFGGTGQQHQKHGFEDILFAQTRPTLLIRRF